MLEPLSVATVVFTIAHYLLDFQLNYRVLAHEGITINPTIDWLRAGLLVTEPFVIALILFFVAGLIYRANNKKGFIEHIHYFYTTILVLATIIISLPVWTGINAEKLFFIGHNMHSILTLGTVLILDFVMLKAKYTDTYKKHLYPHLPTISKVIWLGLAIDFISVAFVFEQAMVWTNKFVFMQIIVGIIIINGIFLSGPVTRKLNESVKGKTVKPLSKKWNMAATISGCISIASWTTITFTDFLKGVDTLSLSAFITAYIGFVILAFIIYETMEHYKVGENW